MEEQRNDDPADKNRLRIAHFAYTPIRAGGIERDAISIPAAYHCGNEGDTIPYAAAFVATFSTGCGKVFCVPPADGGMNAPS